jgi:ketosteroid isomerase-like protein
VNDSLAQAQKRNLELSRRLVDLYEREGPWAVEADFGEFFHPDFEWRSAISALGEQTYVGREGYRAWQEDMEATTGEAYQSDFEVDAIGGHHVLVLSRIRIVGKGSGASYESEYGAYYQVQDGKGVRGRAFLSHDDARQAAEEAARTVG